MHKFDDGKFFRHFDMLNKQTRPTITVVGGGRMKISVRLHSCLQSIDNDQSVDILGMLTVGKLPVGLPDSTGAIAHRQSHLRDANFTKVPNEPADSRQIQRAMNKLVGKPMFWTSKVSSFHNNNFWLDDSRPLEQNGELKVSVNLVGLSKGIT